MTVITDLVIYRTANVLIHEHGDDAPTYAAVGADEMLEKGDLGGYSVWRKTIWAVEEIQRKERREGEMAH